MAVTRKAKELLAELVEQLGAGTVEKGLLRYPTRTESYGLGATDLDYLLSKYIGQQLIVILIPLNPQTEADQKFNQMQEEET